MDVSEIEEGESSGVGKDSEKSGILDSPSVQNKSDVSTTETGVSGSQEGLEIIPEDEKTWPSVVDLNTRLRRVITSYQRNINKKDDIKNVMSNNAKLNQEIKLGTHQGVATMEPPLNMQNWDLQKLAVYLLVSINIFLFL